MSEKVKTIYRVALFRDVTSSYETVFNGPDGAGDEWTLHGYVRMSPWVDVELPRLPPAEVVGAQLEHLAEIRADVVREFTKKLGQIDGQMANLRALTGPQS